jgi:response regulator RpfG family c-di-GMP phosphodiesterase
MTILYNERRRILLIDENSRKLNLRASVLRNHEIEVHLANRLEDAKSLWKHTPYDLVLLAAAENSEEATSASLQIRKIRPRQRIALLVGPPAYVREIGQPSTKKGPVAAPIPEVSRLRPQWPEIVQEVISDWYVDQRTRFALDNLATAPIGEPPSLTD